MPAPSHVFILRHGHRLDMVDRTWIHTTATPWDPPLTPLGLSQSSSTASQLVSHLPTPSPRIIIHTSPFLRCIQTALSLASSLPPHCPAILRVDAWLGEWLTDDYFSDITPPPPMAMVVSDALRSLMRPLEKVTVDFSWPPGEMAELGEDWSSMHARFRRGWKRMLERYEGDNTAEQVAVVLVTHGAGCNALLGAVSERPVLLDVGVGALSMAVRNEGGGYDVLLEAARPSVVGPAVKKSVRSASEAGSVRPSLGLWSPNEEDGGVKGLWKAKGWPGDGEPVKRRWTVGREGMVGLEGVGSVGSG